MKLRLRQGDDPIEVSDKTLLLGLSTIVEVPPKTTARLGTFPQVLGAVTGLLVDRATAEAFELFNMTVGRNSQFVSASPIPLAPFAQDIESWPALNELVFTEDKWRELIDLDICPPGVEFCVEVHNRSAKAARFQGAALYHCM